MTTPWQRAGDFLSFGPILVSEEGRRALAALIESRERGPGPSDPVGVG